MRFWFANFMKKVIEANKKKMNMKKKKKAGFE